jgi:hypothetical protein
MISTGIPLSKAAILGVLDGLIPGLLQYKINNYKNWLFKRSLGSKVGANEYPFDSKLTVLAKRTYNGLLSLVDQYGKMGTVETADLILMWVAMKALGVPGLSADYIAEAKNIFTTAGQLTFSKGMGELGLFTDVDTQRSLGGWSDTFADIFKNTCAFLLSTASMAVSALELVSPGEGAEIDLWLIRIPYGFAAVGAVGLGFYLHSLLTKWSVGGLWTTYSED